MGARSGMKAAICGAIIAAAICGCRSAREVPPTEVVVLDAYARTVREGDTVPRLAEGEAVWWLISAPRGLRLVFPQSAEFSRAEITEK